MGDYRNKKGAFKNRTCWCL